MKEINKKKFLIFITVILLLTTGCQNNFQKIKEIKEEVTSEPPQKEEEIIQYTDSNPLKIALYQKQNGYYERQDKFKSNWEDFKDIGLFSIILDDKEKIEGSSIKSLYQEYSNNYENMEKYKIGYNIKFSLNDGKEFNETILKPLDLFAYPFSDYLYLWLYDDINNSGYYSHLEVNDYNEKTVMSSIKFMSTSLSKEIKGNIFVSVFTYDSDDDFDDNGLYRGNSIFTMELEKNN